MPARFELKKTETGKFMFNLKAGNGEIILTSQSYADKAGAMNGIQSVKAHAMKFDNFEQKVASNAQPYFTLNAANGQVIGKSEMYSSNSAMKNGIESVMRNAAKAEIVEID